MTCLADINTKIDRLTIVVAQLSPFANNMTSTVAPIFSSEGCDGPHANYQCTQGQELANYVNNRPPENPQNDMYSNTYKSCWRNHPNFSYANNSNTLGFQQGHNSNPPQHGRS